MRLRAQDRSELLEVIQRLAPEIEARGEEVEASQTVPPDLVEKLRAAGAFRMIMPREYGGGQMHPLQIARVLQALARADASVAWVVMISVGVLCAFSHFRLEVTGPILATSPDVRIRGAFAPKGVAVATEGGFIVKGRWSLASGLDDHDWVVANCIVQDGAKSEAGAPQMMAALLPRKDVQFLDTWDAVGLRGTCSNDFAIENAFVPESHMADAFTGQPVMDTTLKNIPYLMRITPPHAAIAVGIAQGALDDVAALARTKRPSFDPGRRVAENPIFNYRLGALAARLEGAQAYLDRFLEEMWDMDQAGVQATPMDMVRLRAMSARVHDECVDIVQQAMPLTGANGCYNSLRLQRRWRDIRCVGQHLAADIAAYEQLGVEMTKDEL